MVAHKTLHDRFPESIFFPIQFHAGPHTTLKLKSLTRGTVDRLGRTLLCGGGLSMHFRIFSSTPGLYPLIPVDQHPPLSLDNQICPQTLLLKKPSFMALSFSSPLPEMLPLIPGLYGQFLIITVPAQLFWPTRRGLLYSSYVKLHLFPSYLQPSISYRVQSPQRWLLKKCKMYL